MVRTVLAQVGRGDEPGDGWKRIRSDVGCEGGDEVFGARHAFIVERTPRLRLLKRFKPRKAIIVEVVLLLVPAMGGRVRVRE